MLRRIDDFYSDTFLNALQESITFSFDIFTPHSAIWTCLGFVFLDEGIFV